MDCCCTAADKSQEVYLQNVYLFLCVCLYLFVCLQQLIDSLTVEQAQHNRLLVVVYRFYNI